MNQKLKMWIGNLDGLRQGAVVATSKARAMKVLGIGRTTMDDYWAEQREVEPRIEQEELYTRPIIAGTGGVGRPPWRKGRCPV